MAASSGCGQKRKTESANGGASSKKKPNFAWNKGLLASMDDPELQEYVDEKVVIIKDKYPKAKHHFLVMPKENIPNLNSLKPEHLELLEYLHEKGEEVIHRTDETLKFRLGYHAVPSMSHLHLHVISQDFDSPCLKNKKHWNSFTTEYFFDSEDIMKMLKEKGKVQLDSSKFQDVLKRNLRCHVCRKDFSTMPALKTHIKVHSYKNT
ncbi:aprataxin-like [Mizuhopecten yessoensis]|uniref:Aprataxin n=1 Tax=Mizuhopecten yessoensis TaxID=6573 RepID=A0A210QY14_MIZYE|nr:aprataxin-like [Mizuhopecten yessoensis]OWF53592.1 Aprataxin [Mizuhopecten yessoensis]